MVCVKNREFTLCRLRKGNNMSEKISGISAEQFVQMVCGDQPFSVEFVRKEKDGLWVWEVQLNLPSQLLEKSFMKLFERFVYQHQQVEEAQVSMTIPSKAAKSHFNVRFDYQNAFFHKSAERRLREEFLLALESWGRVKRILATAWEDGLLKAAVEDRKLLEKFDKQNRFEIGPFREAVMERLQKTLTEIASDQAMEANTQVAGNSDAVACLTTPVKILVCQPVKNRQRG